MQAELQEQRIEPAAELPRPGGSLFALATAKLINLSHGSRLTRLLNRVFLAFFRLFQALGLHIVPHTPYGPGPDTRTWKASLWPRRSGMPGIELNEAGQLELLTIFTDRYKPEYDALPRTRTAVPHQYYLQNGRFEGVDAEV